MPSPAHPAVHLTVAAIAESDGRFLLVEEREGERLVINQPAGHLEPDEDLPAAVVRETLEETGWHFSPTALVGIYHWRLPGTAQLYVRLAFCGELGEHDSGRSLDPDIRQVVWLTREELVSRTARMRSPLVLAGIDDYLAGRRYSLDIFRSP